MSAAALRRRAGFGLGAAVLFAALAARSARLERVLVDPSSLTGWALAGLMAFLCAFNSRKRLAMLPLARASVWLRLHVTGGLLALAVFWLHTGRAWPQGAYERALAGLFYLVSLNGILGHLLQRFYPPLLTATGVEVIFERVPEELAKLRERAEKLILECAETTRSDTLARHYAENVDWFLRRPRFLLNHVVAGLEGRQWVRHQTQTVRRYLSEDERRYLDRLTRILYHKNDVDFHYAAQFLMKSWLLIHVPLAVATAALAVWHILLVHAYS